MKNSFNSLDPMKLGIVSFVITLVVIAIIGIVGWGAYQIITM